MDRERDLISPGERPATGTAAWRLSAWCLALGLAVGGCKDAPADTARGGGPAAFGERLEFVLAEEPGVLRSDLATASVSAGRIAWSGGPTTPAWEWRLASVRGTHGTIVPLTDTAVGARSVDGAWVVDRGALVERVRPGRGFVEQAFIIPRPLPLADGEDLLIDGVIATDGRFVGRDGAWRWFGDAGALAMGPAVAFDALGRPLELAYDVDAEGTRIRIAGTQLDGATYPVTIDPAIGPEEFVISDAGATGDATTRAQAPAVACCSPDFLVVYSADDPTPGTADNENEVWGRLVEADSSALALGARLRLSAQGEDGDAAVDAFDPAVAWSPERDQFLVVWSGDRIAGEDEIFGQRVDAAGELVGDVVRISADGTDGDTDIDALHPDVAWQASSGRWIVVWDSDASGNGNQEVYARVVSADGVPVGDSVWVSEGAATHLDTASDSQLASVACDVSTGMLAVAFQSDVSPGDDEILVQLLTEDLALSDGPVNVSEMGEDGAFDAYAPAIVPAPDGSGFLVAWTGDAPETADQQFDVWARRLDASGAPLAGRIAVTATEAGHAASDVAMAFDTADGEWLIAWSEQTVAGARSQIFAATIPLEAAVAGPQVPVSRAPGDASDADQPAVAYAGAVDEFLVAFRADDALDGRVDDEDEVLARFFGDSEATDADADGVRDELDLCPDDWDPGQEDADADGWGDACDSCPTDPAADQPDGCPPAEDTDVDVDAAEGDDAGDAADVDEDGTADAADAGDGADGRDADGGDSDAADASDPGDAADSDWDGPADAAAEGDDSDGPVVPVPTGDGAPGCSGCTSAARHGNDALVALALALVLVGRRRPRSTV